jgi:hypothetical protein
VGLVLALAGNSWADPLEDLAREFWTWRAVQQPLSHDDIPRIERPAAAGDLLVQLVVDRTMRRLP